MPYSQKLSLCMIGR